MIIIDRRREGLKKFQYEVVNPQGIHAAPASLLVNEFNKFHCNVIIEKGKKVIDGKDIFALMGLNIKQNDTIVVTFEGKEENEAVKAVERLLKENL